MSAQFTFRKSDTVGAAGAEEDWDFLSECFVDTGNLETLMDTRRPQRVIVGRTGSGKTALLQKIKQKLDSRVIEIEPEGLSLQFLSNSTILPYLEDLGVDLDIFYRFLWRHIFCIELIVNRYGPKIKSGKMSLIDYVKSVFTGDDKKLKAFEYIENWGASFWEESDVRVREITKHLEQELELGLGADLTSTLLGIKASSKAGVTSRIGETERAEIVGRAQKVINEIQIKKLSDLMDAMKDMFGEKDKTYIVIDQLDEKWVVDKFRYRLIRALIETSRDFRKVINVKIIIAIRRDLLDGVVRMTRDSGFQEEKYNDLYLKLNWRSEDLLKVLDLRVNSLVKRRYTQKALGWKDLLPVKINGKFIIERTNYRPRDVISFFNTCIEVSEGHPGVSEGRMSSVEGTYSEMRLRSLADEWAREYPTVLSASELLRKMPPSFKAGDLPYVKIENFALQVGTSPDSKEDYFAACALKCDGRAGTVDEFRNKVLQVFYVVGLVGLKVDAHLKVNWSFINDSFVSDSEIDDSTTVEICPMYYRALGINPRA